MQNLSDLRETYEAGRLDRAMLHDDPLIQFDSWLEEALKMTDREPNAMTLATVDEQGMPDARTVLLKGRSGHGLVFYSNYLSAKGQQLQVRPNAALLFWWPKLERQVRFRGSVTRQSRAASEAYFQCRPRDSQLGALVSRQSEVVANRRELEERFAELAEVYADKAIPLPEQWGGYILTPVEVEFWQGRPGRLHDRFRYRQQADQWIVERLEP